MGNIVTLTGPSGAGKTTLLGRLLEDPRSELITGITTRTKRPTDLPREYEYVTRNEFDARHAKGELSLATILYDGPCYAAPTHRLTGAVKNGRINQKILSPDGLPPLRDLTLPLNATLLHFFITAPADQLRARMRERGDKEEAIARRLAAEEHWQQYLDERQIPYVFFSNPDGHLEETFRQVRGYIDSQFL